MASTYSTSLRLELMATGDQSGTWGTTTNANLGSLLEQSITGVLSVAQGDVANFTPTSLNGALDQARNAVINLTGAMTAARNMVVPTSNKVYLVKNSTTGGFIVTVKTTAGTGIEVAPNTSRWVYCDGTNVVDGIPGLTYGYATTATAAGTTTLTYGSARQQFFTGATTQTVVLPVASTMVLGQNFDIVNLSSGAVTVNSSGANLVSTISAGGSIRLVCILTSGTSAASWSVVTTDLSAYLPLAGGTMTGQLINTGSSVGYKPIQLISTEAAAAAGPLLDLYRNSASPAANDVLGQLLFNGKDSAANVQEYASIESVIVSPTSTTETGALDIYTTIAGARTKTMSVGPNNPNTPTQFIDGYATTATAAGTTTLTVLSAGQQYFTGSTTQTVVLPVTSTLILGQPFKIVNNSTGLVTVQSSGANTIAVVGPGTQAMFICILTSGTSAASWDYKFGGSMALGVVVASTSGTAITFASVPAWAKRVTMNLTNVSTNGTSELTFRLGAGGSVETTGYLGASSFFAVSSMGSANYTNGFGVFNSVLASDLRNGSMVFTLLDASTNTWAAHGAIGLSTATVYMVLTAGSKPLAGVLDRVSLTTINGTDAFDSGKVNILYEG